MRNRLALTLCIVIGLGALGACSSNAKSAAAQHQPAVKKLIALLHARPDLSESLTQAIAAADIDGVESLDSFYAYVDNLVTWVPVEREAVPKILNLHYVINQAPNDLLNEDKDFNEWLSGAADAWADFLNSPASAPGIESFASMPNYHVNDYFKGPSGWLTFNQFFAREVRAGKRPIADARDDRVIVSPADAVFMGSWPIDENSQVTLKGAKWNIADLLADSPYADKFKNGVYMHSFLYIDDYHRYHVPVGGVVKEARNIHGRIYLDVAKGDDGQLHAIPGDTFQFNQERGLVVIDSPAVGLVAVLPIGMTVVSSVNLTPDVGAKLRKGDEFGFFQFGGSDIVIVFQDKNVMLEAETGKKYLQGQRIGRIKG